MRQTPYIFVRRKFIGFARPDAVGRALSTTLLGIPCCGIITISTSYGGAMIFPALFNLLPQPLQPIEVPTTQDWIIYELLTGIKLPDDYTSYLSRYGTGIIGGIITPFNPFCARKDWKPNYTCRHWMRHALGIKDEKRTFGETSFPYTLYPEAEGVLPWGGTDNGHQLYWITKGAPNEWTVLVNEVRSSHFYPYNYTMTEFLYKWMRGEITCEILPHEDIDQDIVFESF